ncbi:hypothetical protein ZIOFF_019987 [Zingiber officinale]|uniref:Protein kinase domain-containing protein n=1 Tax=Zingiber officinale TaxID=94328 RepID=A0A8J5HAH8_ZINOF|nr:hypothetical protein ZIOFF_019987 [Zingiber officinale]
MIREAVSLPLLAFPILNCLLMLLPVASHGAFSCPNSTSVPCGNVSISYPFWLLSNEPNQISPYCGYQTFTLTCHPSDIPILRLGDDDYRVLDINYNYTVVSLADGVNRGGVPDTCPTVHQNVSLPSNLSLSYADAEAKLTLFFNCSIFNFRRPSLVPPCIRFNESGWEIKYSYDYDCHDETDSGLLAALESYVGNEFKEESARILREVFKLQWTEGINGGDCSYCESSGGRCGYHKALVPDCFCSGGKIEVSPRAPRKKHTTLKIGIVIGKQPNEKKDQTIQDFILQYESTTPKRYTYTEIKRMTKSFSNKLGNGGYGSVFKGSLQDGRLVAVKILSETKGNGEDFINEVASISRTSHVNIVALLGFCLEGSKRAPVYEFMSNGSLDKFIFDDKSNTKNGKLSWEKLYDIAIGIARGLEYLHRGCNTRIVHFDIKPHNILLDHDFFPKISDFGLAKICIQKESIISTMAMRGTPGYIAPELFSRSFGRISSKSDVYSYGMMVLEMIGGRKNFNARADHTSETYFPHWVYDNLDEYCNLTASDSVSASEVSSKSKEIERKMIIVGLWCIQIKPENRPSISMVVDMLEGSISVLQMPPKPEFS